MTPQDRKSWDADYSARGRLWGGALHFLPDLPAGSRILELGCGNGKTLTGLLERGWTVTGSDFSAEAVRLARNRVGGHPCCETLVADAIAAPFRPGSFDAVFSIHLLGHLEAGQRETAVSEIRRILRPGGVLIFSDFSATDFRYGNGMMTEPGTFVRGTGIRTHYFSMDEVRALFAAFEPSALEEKSWSLRVRGRIFPRSEIRAVFRKRGP